MRIRLVLVLVAVGMTVTGVLLVPAALTRISEDHSRLVSAATARAIGHTSEVGAKALPPPPILRAGPVSVPHSGFWAWALLDRKTDQLSGSANSASATNSTESMVKVWLVSDFLRRRAESGRSPTPEELRLASTAIRDSNDNSAQALYELGGGNDVIARLIKICGLRHTSPFPYWWSRTQMTAQDAVRMGECVADQRAAGPQWTKWVLSEMRQVRGGVKDQPPGFGPTGGGRWGIIDGLPADVVPAVSIKNGWTPIVRDGLWHVNCLAVHSEFVLVVQVRYPIAKGLQYGADVCRSVTRQLVRNAQAS
jgi:hypothetical protein